MPKKCPKNPNHKTFITTAHEVHDWLVDENGTFIEDKGCTETAHSPDPDNIWTCATCNTEAIDDKETKETH